MQENDSQIIDEKIKEKLKRIINDWDFDESKVSNAENHDYLAEFWRLRNAKNWREKNKEKEEEIKEEIPYYININKFKQRVESASVYKGNVISNTEINKKERIITPGPADYEEKSQFEIKKKIQIKETEQEENHKEFIYQDIKLNDIQNKCITSENTNSEGLTEKQENERGTFSTQKRFFDKEKQGNLFFDLSFNPQKFETKTNNFSFSKSERFFLEQKSVDERNYEPFKETTNNVKWSTFGKQERFLVEEKQKETTNNFKEANTLFFKHSSQKQEFIYHQKRPDIFEANIHEPALYFEKEISESKSN